MVEKMVKTDGKIDFHAQIRRVEIENTEKCYYCRRKSHYLAFIPHLYRNILICRVHRNHLKNIIELADMTIKNTKVHK